MTNDVTSNPPHASNAASSGRLSAALSYSLLILLLVTNVPLFLCMPLTDDAAMYDLQALNWLQGGVLYRDIVEPNLPGVVWIHAAVRGTLGRSSCALRAVDLMLLGALAALSRRWLVRLGATPATVAWLTLFLFLYYFSLSEWCHCQRDIWLLVPGLAGLTLRCRQIERLRLASCRTRPSNVGSAIALQGSTNARESAACWAFLEGVCWGGGVWLKPMIILPAIGVWVHSSLYVRRWRHKFLDLAGLLLGGLSIGGLGVAWLVWSGAWPHFLVMLMEWNPRYVAAAREQWTLARFVAMQVRSFPWQLLHLAAIPISLLTIGQTLNEAWKSRKVERSKRGTADVSSSSPPASFDASTLRLFDLSTLSVFYLTWLLQSYLLQHLFDYVHAPAILLALVVLAGAHVLRSAESARLAQDASPCDGPFPRDGARGVPETTGRGRIRRSTWRFAALGFAVLVALNTWVIRRDRLSCWWPCLTQGSVPEVRDQLKGFSVPNWQALERVAEYLRAQGVKDRELTCYNSTTVHLYGILGLKPSTRFVYLEQLVAYFPDRRAVFLNELTNSGQRYVVTDLIASGLSPETLARLCPEGALTRPARFPSRLRDVYPWSQPAVFRAGPYLVHRVQTPLGRLATSVKASK